MKKQFIPVFKFLLLVTIIAVISIFVGKLGSSINLEAEAISNKDVGDEVILPRYKESFYNFEIDNDCTSFEFLGGQAEVIISKSTDVLSNPRIEVNQFASCIGNEAAAVNLADKNMPIINTLDSKLSLNILNQIDNFTAPTIRRIVKIYINEDFTYDLNLKFDDIKLTVLSEYKGSINVSGSKGNINCKYIDGPLNINLDSGSVLVQDGLLDSESNINIKECGIINVTANLKGDSGNWGIDTTNGNVQLALENYEKVAFDVSAASIPEKLPKGATYTWTTNNVNYPCVTINNEGGVIKIT